MSDYNNGNQGRWTQGPGGQNQYPGGPGAPDPMRQDQPRPRNGYATVSMICGIFGILCLCCFAFPLAIILGVGAVCFAIISKRGQPFYATAIFGIVLGVIAVVLGIGEFVYFMALSSLVKDPANAALISSCSSRASLCRRCRPGEAPGIRTGSCCLPARQLFQDIDALCGQQIVFYKKINDNDPKSHMYISIA